jgi:hypothetical protein
MGFFIIAGSLRGLFKFLEATDLLGGLPFLFPAGLAFLTFLALAEGLLLFDRVLLGNHISSEGSSSYFS